MSEGFEDRNASANPQDGQGRIVCLDTSRIMVHSVKGCRERDFR